MSSSFPVPPGRQNPRVWVQYNPEFSRPYDLVGTLIYEEIFQGIINPYPNEMIIGGKKQMPFETIEMYKGENKTIHVYVKDKELNPIDITGAVGIFTIKTKKGGTLITQKSTSVSGQGQIGAADAGEMYFYMVPTDTSTKDATQYVWDVKVTLSNGKVYTIIEGVIDVSDTVN